MSFVMRRMVNLFAIASLAIPVASLSKRVRPQPLQGDGRVSPFYSWTRTLPNQPVVLLRTEALPPELGLKAAARQVRLLYASTNGVRGRSIIAVSGALFLPRRKPPVGGWPSVAWAHGTVGVADICAPSWAGRSVRDLTYLNAWLDAGFAVVATDYQGLGTPGPHPYLYTRPAAYDLLDSIRAVTKDGFGLSNKTILVGQSQGGIAVMATGGYAHEYAPDVDIRGIVSTGAGSDRVRPGELPKLDPDMISPLPGYLPLAVLTPNSLTPRYATKTS